MIVYVVGHSVFEISLTSIHTTMDVSKFKVGRVHIRNSGEKVLICHVLHFSFSIYSVKDIVSACRGEIKLME